MKKLLTAVLILVLSAPSTLACGNKLNEKADSEDYLTKMPHMFMRGVANVLVSPAEILVNIHSRSMDSAKPLKSAVEGLGYGTVATVDRLVRGGVDLGSFWVPKFNGIPSNKSPEIKK